MPGEADDLHYSIFSLSEKTVMDYAHLNFLEIEHLPIDVYLGLQRDALIYSRRKVVGNIWRSAGFWSRPSRTERH